MENIIAIAHAVLRGVVDSLKGTAAILYLDTRIRERQQQMREPGSGRRKELPHRDILKSLPGDQVQPKVMKRVLECCVLNGGVCLCSIMFFYGALLPTLDYLLHLTFSESSTVGQLLWDWLSIFLSWIFSIFWVVPLLLLSKVVNSLWFQDIADWAFRYKRGRPQQLSSVSKMIADSLFSILVQILFLAQTLVVGLLPIALLGDLVSFVHLCMLYSLYAFEYKWCNMGWELHQRLTFIENNWPYFLGFGLPLAAITSLHSSYVISGCIFSVLFPLFIVSGNEAEPLTGAWTITSGPVSDPRRWCPRCVVSLNRYRLCIPHERTHEKWCIIILGKNLDMKQIWWHSLSYGSIRRLFGYCQYVQFYTYHT